MARSRKKTPKFFWTNGIDTFVKRGQRRRLRHDERRILKSGGDVFPRLQAYRDWIDLCDYSILWGKSRQDYKKWKINGK